MRLNHPLACKIHGVIHAGLCPSDTEASEIMKGTDGPKMSSDAARELAEKTWEVIDEFTNDIRGISPAQRIPMGNKLIALLSSYAQSERNKALETTITEVRRWQINGVVIVPLEKLVTALEKEKK
jgi:hypothetical protein